MHQLFSTKSTVFFHCSNIVYALQKDSKIFIHRTCIFFLKLSVRILFKQLFFHFYCYLFINNANNLLIFVYLSCFYPKLPFYPLILILIRILGFLDILSLETYFPMFMLTFFNSLFQSNDNSRNSHFIFHINGKRILYFGMSYFVILCSLLLFLFNLYNFFRAY